MYPKRQVAFPHTEVTSLREGSLHAALCREASWLASTGLPAYILHPVVLTKLACLCLICDLSFACGCFSTTMAFDKPTLPGRTRPAWDCILMVTGFRDFERHQVRCVKA